MTTLVTGATGLLGNNVVRLLLTRGKSARVLVRESADPRPLEGLDVETVRGDVRDAAAVRRACDRMDVVIHAAGLVHVGWSQADLHQAINVDGTRNVADGARIAGARMIHVSSISALAMGSREEPADEDTPVRGQIPCPYVLTKRQGEQVLLERVGDGLDAVIVNPAYMLGPWDWKPSSGRMVLAAATRFTPCVPGGGNCFCDVRDVAHGILAAVESGKTGRRYILGGENMTYLQAWQLIARLTGRRGPWFPMGPVVRIATGRIGDLLGRFAGRESDVNSAAMDSAARYQYYRSDRAMAELGYQPRPVQEAARAAWEWFREYGYTPTA